MFILQGIFCFEVVFVVREVREIVERLDSGHLF
jgi:hypothetical protein